MKFKSASILFLLASLCACKKDFLEVENTTAAYRQTYVHDLASMNEFLNGIYQKNYEVLEYYATAAYQEVIADNMKPVALSGMVLTKQYLWLQQPDRTDNQVFGGAIPDGTTMNGVWLSGYRLIRACNFIIEDYKKYRDESPLAADAMAGQAYALRAYFHFKIVNMFAQVYPFSSDGSHQGVPYVSTSDITKPYNRQSVAQVYDQMINDLKIAISLLPENPSDPRYMNKLAAKGLLSRLYLFKQDFVNARQIGLEVTNQIPLLTISGGYPNDIFKWKPLAQSEVLFQTTPATTGRGSLGRYVRQNVALLATSDIAQILKQEPNDIRKSWVNWSGSAWLITKFPIDAAPEVEPKITNLNNSYYTPIIRSTESFLTVSECAAMLGDENEAREYLNAVRKRANPAAQAVSASGTELVDLIRLERRKELSFEGLRMADLQRWKLGVHRIDGPATAKDLAFGSDKSIAPIPVQDVELMGISQNKGY